MSWSEVIEEHRELFPNQSVVLRQYTAFCHDLAPTIAHPLVRRIPIVENGEKLVAIQEELVERVVLLPQPSIPFEGPYFNSGLPQAGKMRASVFIRLQKMVEELDLLAPFFGLEPGQVSIFIFEGLRAQSVQKMLFEKKVEELLLASPELSEEAAETEVSKWISPVKDNLPVHATGAAVDLRFWDEKNDCFLDLGPFGVIWGNSFCAPTFSESITQQQKEYRLLALLAAERAGLTNYVYEWWHFSCGDRYAVYWEEPKSSSVTAVFGAVE